MAGAWPGATRFAPRASHRSSSRPKEGLALINGTQASTALLGLALAAAERLARAADIAAALSIDGLQGSTRPFDPRIHDARGLAGTDRVSR
jgi:histidine ammonia-lyase